MKIPLKCARLVGVVRDILAAGIPVEESSWHYMASMGWERSPAQLVAVLTEEDDSEAESLVELIFYPNEAIQVQLEGLLETETFDVAAERRVMDLLMENPPPVALLFSPEIGPPITIRMPPCAIEPFITRLRITQGLDSRLTRAIGRDIIPENRDRLKVRLRNSRLARTDASVEFLCLFLRRMDDAAVGFLPCFDFILGLINECPGEADFEAALIAKRRAFDQQEKSARQFEERLARVNMETLMLQGDRAPVMGAAAAQEMKKMIDTIRDTLYG